MRSMEGWEWPDEGDGARGKWGEPHMAGKGQGLLKRPGRVMRAREYNR